MDHSAQKRAFLVLDQSVIEELEALQAGGDNKQLLSQLFSMFIERSPLQVVDLHVAIKKADYLTARRISHTLKSGAASIGAHELCQICSEIEQGTKAQNLYEMQRASAQLNSEVQRVIHALREYES